MTLGYCHEKLSLAVFEMCKSTATLKARLRSSLRHGFTAFPQDIFPDAVRQQLLDVKAAFAGVHPIVVATNPPDVLDQMKTPDVMRLLDKVISLRESVAKEYYRRNVVAPDVISGTH
jgi:hypothetical protein